MITSTYLIVFNNFINHIKKDFISFYYLSSFNPFLIKQNVHITENIFQ